jgi:uncharacterized membrane protein (DUF4010 family)
MSPELSMWPYMPTLARLALALAIGLFIGIERERRQKVAGVRTFAFAAVLGAVGGLLGEHFGLLAIGLLGVLVVLLNLDTLWSGEGAEITTSAALLVTGFAGLLAGQGHTFTPTLVGIVTAALLAWKEPLAGFSHALTESELRSAILLAILAFVVYPVLPPGTLDPWGLIDPREAWITVILIAALGFANYVLLKLYGTRGIELTGFLGGLVNSTVTVTELASRAHASRGGLAEPAFRGVLLATAAMLVRNAIILGILAPAALLDAGLPLLLMCAAATLPVILRGWRLARRPGELSDEPPIASMQSPFSLTAALKFGLIFLGLEVAGTFGQHLLGQVGFYAVSVIGGVVSSASAVASAGTLAARGAVEPAVAGAGAVLASVASAVVHVPVVARATHDRGLTRRVAVVIGAVVAAAAVGTGVQLLLERVAL